MRLSLEMKKIELERERERERERDFVRKEIKKIMKTFRSKFYLSKLDNHDR